MRRPWTAKGIVAYAAKRLDEKLGEGWVLRVRVGERFDLGSPRHCVAGQMAKAVGSGVFFGALCQALNRDRDPTLDTAFGIGDDFSDTCTYEDVDRAWQKLIGDRQAKYPEGWEGRVDAYLVTK